MVSNAFDMSRKIANVMSLDLLSLVAPRDADDCTQAAAMKDI